MGSLLLKFEKTDTTQPRFSALWHLTNLHLGSVFMWLCFLLV